MFSIRNVGGVALFLAGTTWLWLTPAFASRDVSTSGLLWQTTRVLSLLTLAAFSVATWGLFARHGWWEQVAIGAAVLGLVTLVPYAMAALDGGEPRGGVVWNTFIHVLMAGGVLVLLLVPTLERWVDGHVMGG